jgi:hypothetical protein
MVWSRSMSTPQRDNRGQRRLDETQQRLNWYPGHTIDWSYQICDKNNLGMWKWITLRSAGINLLSYHDRRNVSYHKAYVLTTSPKSATAKSRGEGDIITILTANYSIGSLSIDHARPTLYMLVLGFRFDKGSEAVTHGLMWSSAPLRPRNAMHIRRLPFQLTG